MCQAKLSDLSLAALLADPPLRCAEEGESSPLSLNFCCVSIFFKHSTIDG